MGDSYRRDWPGVLRRERFGTRPHHHTTLGDTVEIIDHKTRQVRGIYSGPYADQRADQRARELNAEERSRTEDDS